MINARAMQVSGSLKTKPNVAVPMQSDIKPRYMAMGSWHASLSSEGRDTRKGKK